MSEELKIATKRRVEVCVGCPDMLDGFPLKKIEDMPHHAECYFITFVGLAEADGSENGFTAQTLCLCPLATASAAWLQGASDGEVRLLMTKHTRHNHQ